MMTDPVATEWARLRQALDGAREAVRLRLHHAESETLIAIQVVEREVEHLGVTPTHETCHALRLEVMRLAAIADALDRRRAT